MVLEGDTQYITRSGQFINIELEGKFLRRPISVSDYDAKTITIIYKVVGRGTEQMRGMKAGQKLDILTGLGNGFSTENEAQQPLLVGGGVGVPPLYNLAKPLSLCSFDKSLVLYPLDILEMEVSHCTFGNNTYRFRIHTSPYRFFGRKNDRKRNRKD